MLTLALVMVVQDRHLRLLRQQVATTPSFASISPNFSSAAAVPSSDSAFSSSSTTSPAVASSTPTPSATATNSHLTSAVMTSAATPSTTSAVSASTPAATATTTTLSTPAPAPVSSPFSSPLFGTLQSVTHAQPFLRNPASIPISKDLLGRCLSFQVPVECHGLIISKSPRRLLSPAKAGTTASALASDALSSVSDLQGLSPAKDVQKATFPKGVEALVLGVCDETEVAELKLKVGEFEMHLKRDIGSQTAATPVAPPPMPAPVPIKPTVESGPTAPQASSQKSIPASSSPFVNISSPSALKLAALDASGSNTYVLVSCPTVGLFQSCRTVKGKRQPPSCKEGDLIKEGQIIGFLDQFGSELPVKSNVAGEVLKLLHKDGEPVGYGDPLVAVLPSFRGIK